MPIFPDGYGPPITDPDDISSGDVFLMSLSGLIKPVDVSAARSLIMPSDTVDATDFTANGATLLESADTLTGWSSVGSNDALVVDTVVKTQGTGSVRATPRLGTASAALWFDFGALQSPAGHTFLAFDVYYYDPGGPGITNHPDYFAAEITDGAAFTGNAVQIPFPPFAINTWRTFLLPVAGLAGIRSVGVRRILQTGGGFARVGMNIDNIRWPAQSEVDAALNSATTVIVPANYTETDTAFRYLTDDRSILDLRPDKAHLSRAGGFRHTREWNLNEDGVTDVAGDINAIIASLPNGTTLDFPPGVAFRCDSMITINGKRDLNIRFNRARIYSTALRANDAVQKNKYIIYVSKSDNVILDSPRIFGYRETIRNGSTMFATSSNLLSELNRNCEDRLIPGGLASVPVWVSNANATVTYVGRTGGGIVIEDNVGLQTISVAAGDMSIRNGTGTSGIPVKPSASYTFSTMTRHNIGGTPRNVRIDAAWYDASGTIISTSTGTATIQATGENSATVTQAHTSPSNAAFVTFISVVVGVGAGEAHSFDSFSVSLTTPVTLVVSGTTSVLSAMHAENRIDDTSAPARYGRDIDGYNNFTIRLSDTAQVANDCELTVFDSSTGKILARRLLTLTATPTDYVISRFLLPDDLGRLQRVTVRKMTATTNSITVHTTTEYMRNTYAAAIEQNVGIYAGLECNNLTILNSEIEGVGGDAISSSVNNSFGMNVYGGFSRCCCRQGVSFNFIKRLRFYDYTIREPGRSAFDFEPAGPDWYVDDVVISRVRIFNVRNYAFAMNPWARMTNFDVSDIRAYDCGGFMAGGCRDSSWSNCKNIRTTSQAGIQVKILNDIDWTINGVNVVIDNCETVGGWRLSDGHGASVDYGLARTEFPSAGVILRNSRVTSPYGRVLVRGNHKVENVTFTREDEPMEMVGTRYVGPLELFDGAFSTFDVGQYNVDLPNSFKGRTALGDTYWPGGLNMKADPVYAVRGLSGTSTKANNLRGVEDSVAQTATSHAVVFPARPLPGTVITLLGTTGGALTPSVTYYYRVAMRDRYGGPALASAQVGRGLSASQNAMSVKISEPFDPATGYLRFGFTIYRGTVSGGPYTARFDIMPITQWPSIGPGNGFIDKGTSMDFAANDGQTWGYPPSTSPQAGSFTPVDESGYEPDDDYAVMVETNWATTVHVTAKTTAGFTINFGTAAPAGAKVSWLLVR